MHADAFLRDVAKIAERIDRDAVERLAELLDDVRESRSKVFVIGLGGSLSNAEHCAADLRKLCDIDAHAPNVAEMSAYINDAGPEHAFRGHLQRMDNRDVLLVLSVGGGTPDVSTAIVEAINRAKTFGHAVFGIVGPDGGYTARQADVVIKIPCAGDLVTPYTEAFQAVVWHALVSHPRLQRHRTKW